MGRDNGYMGMEKVEPEVEDGEAKSSLPRHSVHGAAIMHRTRRSLGSW